MNTEDNFLRGLEAAVTPGGDVRLSAATVNAVGAGLGLSREQIANLVEQLKSENALELYWGGAVSLTPTGRERAAGKPASAGSITYFGPGVIYAPNAAAPVGHGAGSAHSTIAVGGSAASQGSSIVMAATCDLVSALQALQRHQANLPEAATLPAQNLAHELKTTIEELQRPSPDKAVVKNRLGRIETCMSELGRIADAGAKIGPVLLALGGVLSKLTGWAGP